MILQTERLTLRLITANDLDNIHALHLFPETDKYNTQGIPETIDETRTIVAEWLKEQDEAPAKRYTFYIENRQLQFIGLIGIKVGRAKYRNAEIWYKMHPAQWNNGYATEALKQVLHHGFNDLNYHRIEAGCALGNVASAKVLLKAGFTQEGRTREKLPIRGEWSDGLDFAILKDDYFKTR